MGTFVIPHNPTTSTVEIWAGWWNEGIRPRMNVVVTNTETQAMFTRSLHGQWTPIGRDTRDGRRIEIPACTYRMITLRLLLPNSSFRAALVDANNGAELAFCFFETLPTQLQNRAFRARSRRPFTMMLGSCYWDGPQTNQVSSDYFKVFMDPRYTPHLKMLVGDQVYVDQPPSDWADLTMSQFTIQSKVNARYHSSWHRLMGTLRLGANVCSTDDHEYWNDYPWTPLAVWPAIRARARVRNRLRAETNRFAREVQRATNTRVIAVGGAVSIFVLDTRLNRSESQFATANDLRRLRVWIRGLTGPGVLVVGQPLLAYPVGIVDVSTGIEIAASFAGAIAASGAARLVDFAGLSSPLGAPVGSALGPILSGPVGQIAVPIVVEEEFDGEISDRNLPYYKSQYRSVVRAISRSNHDMLVLSGDIHLGRIARFKIHKRDGSDPTRVFEVISSPLTRLDTGGVDRQDLRGRSAPEFRGRIPTKHHPRIFPPMPELTDPRAMIAVVDYVRHIPPNHGQQTQNHFMTLSFVRGTELNSVKVTVRAWGVGGRNPDNPQLPRRLFTESFVLNEGRLPPHSVPDRRVTGAIFDDDGDILALVNPHETWSPRLKHEAINDISNGLARYHVRMDSRTPIRVVRDRVRNIVYLRTTANPKARDNLDNLPAFPNRDWH